MRFVPAAGFTGSATLRYKAWDGTLTSRLVETAKLLVTADPAGPANAAPVLDTAPTPTLTPVAEDTRSPRGDSVASLLGSAMSDADAGAVEGVAITGAISSGLGTWQYSINNGGSWLAMGLVSETSALLLRDSDKVRFVPARDAFGPATLSYRAWDRTRGAAGARADLTKGTGGSSPFSTAVETASIAVAPVNDAPVLDTRPNTMLDPAGNLVSALLGTLASDVDGDTIGIAIIAATGSGEWQVDAGSGWEALGPVSNATPRLLNPTDQVRFVPATGFIGVARLRYQAWDGTTVSRAIETATLTVNTVDDRPILDTRGNPTLTPVAKDDVNAPGDLVSSLLGTWASDPDAGADLGIAIVSAQTTGGEWQVDTGSGWEALGPVTGSAPRRLHGGDRIRFVPSAGFVGTAKLRYKAWDAASADANGPLSLSAAVETATVAVNTAPVLSV